MKAAEPVPETRPTPTPPVTAPPRPVIRSSIIQAFQQRDYQRVVEEYEKIRHRYPSHIKGADDLFYLGSAYYYLQQNEKALKAFLEFQYRFPDDDRTAEIVLLTAKVYRRMGKIDRALTLLRQVVYMTADRDLLVRSWEEKADILAGQGMYLDSLSVLDEAYRTSAPRERKRIMTRIKELLLIMPPETIVQSIIPGRYNFPREEARQIYERARKRSDLAEEEGLAEQAGLPEEPDVEQTPAAPKWVMLDLPPEAERPLLKIGVVIPSGGRMETYGTQVRRGIELLLASLPGTRFPFRLEAVYVSEEGGESAWRGMEELAASAEVLALIGPLLSRTVEKIMPLAEKSGLAVISPTASSPRLSGISPNFFRNCLTLESLGRSLVGFAMDVLGLTRFAIFSPEDVYGFHYADILREEVAGRGAEVVASATYDPALTDFSKPILALKKAAGIPDPYPEDEEYELPFEALFLPGFAEQAGLIVPQLVFHDIDLKRVAVLGGSELNTEHFPKIGEEYAEGVFFADGFFAGSPRLEVQRFVARYRRKYGEDPGTFSAQAYDAAAIVADILGKGAATRSEVMAALGEVKDFPGVTGRTTLIPGGHSGKRAFFGTVARGRLVSVHSGR